MRPPETMTLAIHNTLTRRKDRFDPLVPGKAGLYVCGPTVYDFIHVGNARTFSVFDLVVRWLRATGYEVTYVRKCHRRRRQDRSSARANVKDVPLGEYTDALHRRGVRTTDCARARPRAVGQRIRVRRIRRTSRPDERA